MVRYKQAFLGVAWAILQPLSLMFIFTIIFSILVPVPTDGVPYPIFVYSALMLWTFFANSINNASVSIISNSNLVTKVYFPCDIFPLASVMEATIDFGIASILFIGMMFFYKIHVTASLLFVIPILLTLILFTIGVSLIAAALNVFYRDVQYVVPLLLQVWMFASPIIYTVNIIPERFRKFYMLNPLAGLIDSFRRVVIYGTPPDLQYLTLTSIISVLLFGFAYIIFKKQETKFSDVI